MALEQSIFAAFILLVILLIIVAGLICYLLRNHCLARYRSMRTLTGSKEHKVVARHGPRPTNSESLEGRAPKTLEEQDSSKLLTFDQILKKEERSTQGQAPVITLRFGPQVDHDNSSSQVGPASQSVGSVSQQSRQHLNAETV